MISFSSNWFKYSLFLSFCFFSWNIQNLIELVYSKFRSNIMPRWSVEFLYGNPFSFVCPLRQCMYIFGLFFSLKLKTNLSLIRDLKLDSTVSKCRLLLDLRSFSKSLYSVLKSSISLSVICAFLRCVIGLIESEWPPWAIFGFFNEIPPPGYEGPLGAFAQLPIFGNR